MSKSIINFIKRDYSIVSPCTNVKAIKEQLTLHSAIVVMAKTDIRPMGILTPIDVAYRPHSRVSDCILPKPSVSPASSLEDVLEIMWQNHAEALPVYQNDRFEGIVLKKSLVAALEITVEELNQTLLVLVRKTNKKRMLLQQQASILQEINSAQSHELRQPVANILALMQLLDLSNLNENNREILGMLNDCANQADNAIKGLAQKIGCWSEALTSGISN
ncbi:CBS domain-containing protein [Foetidibacter luteolus]|uniref:CBS domain-containing protein n=1 Tax=Foetidibacter luteolus TaxID=2608880 RepID=UPI00129AF8C2|nr:CBS domain-containing protein [Foetidibacter luteolus]